MLTPKNNSPSCSPSLNPMGRLVLLTGVLVVMLALSCLAARASEIKIIYPDREGIKEKERYPFALLALAVAKSQPPCRLVPSSLPMTDARARIELEKKRLSIAWFGTSKKFEQEFRPIPFPITQGILGHRLLVIHRDNQHQFSGIKRLEDLKELSAGQGVGWADVNILRHAGLDVKTDEMDTLFRMINRSEIIDYFPLGANEIFNLVTEKRAVFPNLAVEKHLVIVYPFDFFFFVHADDSFLHDIVYKGLLKAYADGSFEKLFTSHPDHSAFLNRADLKNRRKIILDNPILSQKAKGLLKTYSYTR